LLTPIGNRINLLIESSRLGNRLIGDAALLLKFSQFGIDLMLTGFPMNFLTADENVEIALEIHDVTAADADRCGLSIWRTDI
jgi:hypothetical protein